MHFDILLQYCLPHHLLSRLLGVVMRTKITWLKNFLIRFIMKRYGISLDEAEIQDINAFKTFNAFFTRALKKDARPISDDHRTIVSPADGTISQIGSINEDAILQAKGFNYSLTALMAGDAALAAPFMNGLFNVVYLSPKDYHRVHMPLTGELTEMIYVPGRLFSVGPNVIDNVPRVFARNERVICMFQTEVGPMAVILVGAMLVASIETSWAGLIAPSRPRKIQRLQYPLMGKGPVVLNTGDELGRFQFGSTVIVLFPRDGMGWLADMAPNKSVKMGDPMGVLE